MNDKLKSCEFQHKKYNVFKTVVQCNVFYVIFCHTGICVCILKCFSHIASICHELSLLVSLLNFGHSPSKHPSAPVEKWLNRSGQSEEAPADPGATYQSSEADTGQAAALQLPCVFADDRSWSSVSGEQEGLSVLQAGLSAQRQNVWWVMGRLKRKYSHLN